jgi:hypothetical protein
MMRHTVRSFGVLAALLVVLPSATAAAAAAGPPPNGSPTVAGLAILPAETYVSASEPSGSLLGAGPVNGIVLPLADQPVQGFSGVAAGPGDTFDVISDNGYGSKANSADFVLRIHRLAVDFRTGAIDVVGGINLTDPAGKVPFALTRPDRVLTGADFDVESIVAASDGTWWLGDEFGPFLLHVDRAGRLLQAPIPMPGVFAPENPERGNTSPNLGSSRGFEGMAVSPDGRTAYPMLQGTVTGDPAGTLRLSQFDLRTGRYTDRRWSYPLDNPAYVIGDLVAVDANRFLVVEQDTAQGDDATTRRVYLVDRRHLDPDGRLAKTLVVDLLNVANPRHVGGLGQPFRFPLSTEALVVIDGHTIGVLNDNNFPLSSILNPGRPDDNEFVTVHVARSLHDWP